MTKVQHENANCTEVTDIKTRKLLLQVNVHPESSTRRLKKTPKTKRKEGGRGPVSIRVTIQDETRSWSTSKGTPLMMNWRVNVSGSRNPNIEEEEQTIMGQKSIYSMYHQHIVEVSHNKSYQWLERTGLKDSTETLIMTLLDQGLLCQTRPKTQAMQRVWDSLTYNRV